MIFRLTSHIYFLSHVLFFLSCSSTEPAWIKSRPNDELFWHGVGYASFDASNNPNAKAKEHAIHEISSQIKVSISSEMDMIVRDFNGSVENTIKSVMSSRVNLLLPELEFPSSYNSKEGVFFYARLNKEKYRLAMKRLRENAKQTSLSYLIESDKYFGISSFNLLQKAWEEILPFNDETIKVNYLDEEVNLYTLISLKINQFESRLSILANVDKRKMRTFVDRSNTLEIVIKDKIDNKTLSGIPIKISYLGQNHVLYSDSKGKINHGLVLSSKVSLYDIQFRLDYDALLPKDERRKHYLPINSKWHSIIVEIVPARANLVSIEKNINSVMDETIIEPAIKQYFNQKVEFVTDSPDIIIKIESNTEEKTKRVDNNFPYFVFGNVSVSILDPSTEKVFYNTYVSNIKGGDFDSKYLAGIRAYDNMVEQLINQLDLASLFN